MSDEYYSDKEIDTLVERTLLKRESMNSSISIPEMLEISAPKSSEYWRDLACGLHRQELHYDAFDCWKVALKHNEPIDEYILRDMAYTLQEIGLNSNDSFFLENSKDIFLALTKSFLELGKAHLWNDNVSDALRVWSKGLTKKNVSLSETLGILISQLEAYSHVRNL